MRVLPALAALTLLAPACLDDSGPTAQVGSSTRSVATPITWVSSSLINATASPNSNDLTKTASQDSYNAGAISVETIESRGFVEFKTAETNTTKAIGLSNFDANDPNNQNNQTLGNIDFGIWLYWDGTSGIVKVSEGGMSKGTFGTYTSNDVFRVEVKQHTQTGVVVRYWWKHAGVWTMFYESTNKPEFPLQVDTSLKTPNATIRDVVMWAQATPDTVHVSTQNNPLVPDRLHCGENDVIVISQKYLGAGQTPDGVPITLEDFADETIYSQAAIQDILEDHYLADFPSMGQYEGPGGNPITIILDIENPHPQALWSYTPEEQVAIVEAYKRRIAAVKATFDNAWLGLYGTLNPNSTGTGGGNYGDRHDALVAARALGLYDDLTYLVPVLYVRFGCDDDGFDDLNNPLPCDNDWDTLDEYTELGITGSRDLADRPLLPFLTVYVHNTTTSNFHGTMLLDLDIPDPFYATLGTQLDILANNGVDDAALWIGAGGNYDDPNRLPSPDALDVGGATNPKGWTIDDYACAF